MKEKATKIAGEGWWDVIQLFNLIIIIFALS